MKIKFVDAFSGIGGFHLAIDQASKELNLHRKCVLSIEKDKHCQSVYRKNFNIDPLGDITKIEKEKIPNHNLFVGGFPCQPFSSSGSLFTKNKGKVNFDGDIRSNLIFHILDILRMHKPENVVLENVKGILTAKNSDGSSFLDSIVLSLEDIGYSIQYKLLKASDYGLAQLRERVIFVASLSKDLSDFKFPDSYNYFKTVVDIVETNVDDKYYLDQHWNNYYLKKDHGSFLAGTPRLDYLKYIYQSESRKSDTKKERRIILDCEICGETPNGRSRQRDRLYSPYGLSPTINCTNIPVFSFKDGWRALTPLECMRLQGFPDSFIKHEKEGQVYKQAGNAVPVNMIKEVIKALISF